MEKNLHEVYLALGSNLGDKKGNMLLAIKNIEERIGDVIAYSAFFETEPQGFVSENTFLNAACCVRTSLNPFELLATTKEIEKDMGRKTKSVNRTYADRVIDIDLLLFDSLILQTKELVLPHPHLHERDFVLFPLAEIAFEVVHPILHKTIGELKNNL